MKLGISDKGYKKIAQNIFEVEDEYDEEDYSGMVLVLEDSDEEGFVDVYIEHRHAREFAEHDQTIRGTAWETDDAGFAYASFPNEPGLLRKLDLSYGSYGMKIDDGMYTPMEDTGRF